VSAEVGYLTKCFRALDYCFSVETTDPALGQYLDSLFEPLGTTCRAAAPYALIDRGEGTDERYGLYVEGEHVLWTSSPGSVIENLLWQINSRVVSESTGYLLLHAAAAELGGRAVVLPAASGSGKSTLVAGLLRSGCRYLTDEAVAIHPATGLIHPFPKPLSIKSGSWPVLSELQPSLGPDLKGYATIDWLVDARQVRPDALAPPSRPALVVSPAYRAGAHTRLLPIRRVETLMMLIKNSFNLAVHGQTGLDRLAAIARQAPGYQLEMGDLGAACALIVELLNNESEQKGHTASSHSHGPSGHDE
jgi:HprK-related kinase A